MNTVTNELLESLERLLPKKLQEFFTEYAPEYNCLTEASILQHEFAALRFQVAPAFLPLFGTGDRLFAIHVRPGRALAKSPLVRIERDEQQARYLLSDLSLLPLALIPLTLFDQEDASVRSSALDAINSLQQEYNGTPLSEEWRSFGMTCKTFLWSAGHPDEDVIWKTIDPKHPFCLGAWPALRQTAEEAQPILQTIDSNEPEVLAMKMSAGLSLGIPPKKEDLLTLLSAESFRGVRLKMGRWSAKPLGEGLESWDECLRNLPEAERAELLSDTPFEPLIADSRAYSGTTKTGLQALQSIATTFAERGEFEAALTQTRNALHASVFHYAQDEPLQRELLQQLLDQTNVIEQDGVATKIVSATIQGLKEGV